MRAKAGGVACGRQLFAPVVCGLAGTARKSRGLTGMARMKLAPASRRCRRFEGNTSSCQAWLKAKEATPPQIVCSSHLRVLAGGERSCWRRRRGRLFAPVVRGCWRVARAAQASLEEANSNQETMARAGCHESCWRRPWRRLFAPVVRRRWRAARAAQPSLESSNFNQETMAGLASGRRRRLPQGAWQQTRG